jgi:hypothetical protein
MIAINTEMQEKQAVDCANNTIKDLASSHTSKKIIKLFKDIQ